MTAQPKKRCCLLIAIICILVNGFLCRLFANEGAKEPVRYSHDFDQLTNKDNNTSRPAIRDLLSDNTPGNNAIYFGGGSHSNKGLAHQFMEQLTYNIVKDIPSIDDITPANPYEGKECLLSEIYQYSMFEGEIRENNYIKRRLAAGAAIDSTMIFLEKTEVYHSLKHLEQTLSKYLIIEMGKMAASEKAMIYLPGERPTTKEKEKMLYNVSLSTLFYSSTDTFKGYYSMVLNCRYLETQTSTLYDFGKQELKFRVKNASLDRYLASNIDFTVIHDNENVDTFILRMLFNY